MPCKFEAPQIFGETRRALKRLSILASFCQICNHKCHSLSIIAIIRPSACLIEGSNGRICAGIALAVHSGPSPVIV